MDANASQIAPFVLKTYEMVSDPNTDDIISWSRRNNSFVVVDPFAFSQRLLPTYFKHSNFSSFVRQLNTYGFKKVDPDRWEFGNEWFLRGQGQLLMNIIRRRNCHEAAQAEVHHQNQGVIEETTEQLYGLAERLKQEEKVMMGVLDQLKEEQRAIEEEVKGISRRLYVTEKRPLQMMTFLVKAMENPDMIPRITEEEEKQNKKKKPRLISGDQQQMETMGCPSQGWLGLEGQPGLERHQDGLDCLQYQQEDLPPFSSSSSIATASNEVRSVVSHPHSAPFHWGGSF